MEPQQEENKKEGTFLPMKKLPPKQRLSRMFAKQFVPQGDIDEDLAKKAELKEKKGNLVFLYKNLTDILKDTMENPDSPAFEDLENDEQGLKLLKESIKSVHPLYFFSQTQVDILFKCVKFKRVFRKYILYGHAETDKKLSEDKLEGYILLEGEVHFFSQDGIDFKDLINPVSLFGYDGPIFRKRSSKALIMEGSLVAVIDADSFCDLIRPFSKFATYLSRIIYLKDKVLDDLNDYKNFVLSSVDQDYIDMRKAIGYFKKIDSCLHIKCNDSDIDFIAWSYALNRLPPNVISTYIFILVNEHPNILRFKDQLKDKIEVLICKARPRSIYKLENGKDVIIMRDLEADVLDFVSNMCIHIIESGKLRKKISAPLTLEKVIENARDFDSTIRVLKEDAKVNINKDEEECLRKYFGDHTGKLFGKELVAMSLNHQDVAIQIIKKAVTDKDAVEKWSEQLWAAVKETLGTDKSLDEIDDLVVDICQGSKSTLLNCLSSHLYENKHEILNWAHKKEAAEDPKDRLMLKTKDFLDNNYKLIAYSFYYYLSHKEKEKEKELMNEQYGIIKLDNTCGTGVKIVIINVNKLNKDKVDPAVKIKPASKNHIILHIGYTFGNQAKDIINPILLLFGKHARSLNILGKAGGLVGKRSDILMADKIFWDKNNELTLLNPGEVDIEQFKREANTDVHLGPMLTVAGTILQNNDLLRYYKNVNGCVGLEMEGFFYAKEVENAIKAKLVRDDFICRFIYYTSDCPLVPEENLANEGLNVDWDEGVGAMNAAQRFVLNQIFK